MRAREGLLRKTPAEIEAALPFAILGLPGEPGSTSSLRNAPRDLSAQTDHLRSEVEGSRKRRIYDAPATPFERLEACGVAGKEQRQPWKISIALWILSRSKKPSRPSCAPCCVTKLGRPFSKRPESAQDPACSQTGSSGLAPAPELFPSGLGLPLPRLPAFVNKPTPVSFSLRQRIASYF